VLIAENCPSLFNLMKRDEEHKFRIDFTHVAFSALYRLVTCFGVPFLFASDVTLGAALEILPLGESLGMFLRSLPFYVFSFPESFIYSTIYC
jgi:hypothetical protein